MRAAGFTMIELIVIILIMGVLAVVAVPRMLDRAEFDAFAYSDSAQALVRYAQKVAIAQRRSVYVVISANNMRACFVDASCVTSVPDPSNVSQALMASAPAGTSLSPAASFYFNGLGKPSFAGNLTVTMNSSVTRSFTIDAETGLVHP